MNNVILKNWSVCGYQVSPYTAPEARLWCLHGDAYGHPEFPDGDSITTSPIKNSIKNLVETENTVYELGEPDVSYILWCEDNGITIDEDNPVKMKEFK